MRLLVPVTMLLLTACAAPVKAPVATPPVSSSSMSPPALGPRFVWPLDDAEARITKKSFGTFVTPEDSPVQPERFTGYHAGIDFELLSGESEHDVEVRAICDGPVLRAQNVGGYGGVVVQLCALSGTRVTVLYGHLALPLIDVALDQELKTGDRIGVLGEGFSSETDGERPHLHLSVHRGENIEWRGYAHDEQTLGAWIDPARLIVQ